MDVDRDGTPFCAVLDVERAHLGRVRRVSDLQQWRRRVVSELMDARSPYAQALRGAGGTCAQRAFLTDWRLLMAETVRRVLPPTRASEDRGAAVDPDGSGPDPDELALSILAALHGGAVLSWLADDERPLEAAFDVALAPVAGGEDSAQDS